MKAFKPPAKISRRKKASSKDQLTTTRVVTTRASWHDEHVPLDVVLASRHVAVMPVTNGLPERETDTSVSKAPPLALPSSFSALLEAATGGAQSDAVDTGHAQSDAALVLEPPIHITDDTPSPHLEAIASVPPLAKRIWHCLSDDPDSDVMEESISAPSLAQSPVLTNWTVKRAGKVSKPRSDDYATWTLDQLRSECAARSLGLPRKTSKEIRIKKLREHDQAHDVVCSRVDPELLLPVSMRKTKHCIIRLLNVLFSDRFSDRFATIGNRQQRYELDNREDSVFSIFWRDVTAEAHFNLTDYNNLWSPDPLFSDLDPSKIVPHPTQKYLEMWKNFNRKYAMAVAKFTQSGHHDPNFYSFCDGNVALAYLRVCLEVKPNLLSFVNGGFRDVDALDSTRLTDNVPQVYDTQQPSRSQMMEVLNAISCTSKAIMRDTALDEFDRMIERVSRLHTLIHQVEQRMAETAHDAATQEKLQNGLRIYQKRLKAYEDRLDKM